MNVPAKFTKSLVNNLKRYQDLVLDLKKKDVKESDTVTVVTDILADVFCYDKYKDITSEFAIRGNFCDLAIKDDKGKPKLIIEVKAIGLKLNDSHIKQAIDYATNSGIEYSILTNAVDWKVYKVIYKQPIDKELVYELDFTKLSTKNLKDVEMLFAISKHGNVEKKSAIDDIYFQKQVKNHYVIGNIILREEIINSIKKELKRIFPEVKITNNEIDFLLKNLVLKSDIIEGDETLHFKKIIDKLYNKLLKSKTNNESKKSAPTENKSETENIN